MEVLRKKRGVEFGAERHQLRFDTLEAGRGPQCTHEFAEKALGGAIPGIFRGHEKAADETFVILEDVEAVSDRIAAFDRGIAAKGMRVDKFSDQVNGGSIVPKKFFAPALGFFLEESLERPGMQLPEVNNLHRRVPPLVIISRPSAPTHPGFWNIPAC